MTQEEKQLLLKDLCGRLDCGVICHSNKINLDGKLLFINKVYNIVALYNDRASGEFDICPISDIKPYLRPMSSMTEEELEEYTSYCFEQPFLQKDKTPNLGSVPMCIDWLNAHHFDYRNLIERGLALEAPKDIYD